MDYVKFLNFLSKYEGVKLTAYQDSVGVWTIGIGSIRHPNGDPVKKGDKITLEQAYQYAEGEAKAMYERLMKALKVPQNENQQMALLSLAYNIGIAGLESSSVLKSINEKKDAATIEANWHKWCKGRVNGQLVVLPGLLTRRKSEFKVYTGYINP